MDLASVAITISIASLFVGFLKVMYTYMNDYQSTNSGITQIQFIRDIINFIGIGAVISLHILNPYESPRKMRYAALIGFIFLLVGLYYDFFQQISDIYECMGLALILLYINIYVYSVVHDYYSLSSPTNKKVKIK